VKKRHKATRGANNDHSGADRAGEKRQSPPHKGTLSIYSYLHGGTLSLEGHNDHEKDVVMPTFLSLFLGVLIL
jgi:hypothetical protein